MLTVLEFKDVVQCIFLALILEDSLMIVNKGNSIVWFGAHKGVLQKVSEVITRALFARLVEVHVQRNIKECSLR